MARRIVSGVLVALALGGCSHTWYQFDVSANERTRISNAKNALATASRADANALAQVVDLSGRRAVETLVAGMTVERTDGEEQRQKLTRALYIGIMGDAEDPMSALDQDITWMAARVGQRVASHGLTQMGLGGIGAMVGAVADDSGQRLRQMQASLHRGQIATCQAPNVIVSYDAGILGHIHTQLTDSDADYQRWRERVRAIHLVRFTCRSQYVLMLLTRNRGEAGLRVIGWHFVTPEQWQRMEPRLRDAFDLPS
ncbi:MAG TPA: hypothetical protein RMH99_00085 [Sandaracinaceae bacterium LLY-WYZ-13_1]|nr:hypothetical protein [Sandaracinaceae bacterium LLY-WYZ-13_1]